MDEVFAIYPRAHLKFIGEVSRLACDAHLCEVRCFATCCGCTICYGDVRCMIDAA